jgi:DNA polymerase-1
MEQADNKRLLLIDGHSMAFRAFYAMGEGRYTTSTGEEVGAVMGFVTMLVSLLTERRPSHLGVAFDVSRKTFRNEIDPQYKATRPPTPPAFIGQVPLIKQVLQALGICYCELSGYEADDIIATWVTQARSHGLTTWVCSGDRDSFQLIDQTTTVLYPRKGVRELDVMTPDAVAARYGLSPQLYPDLAALVGEASDNLPGVPGVGPKTAAKWLTEYGSLSNLLEHRAELSGKVGESLRASVDRVLLNRQMATPVTDLQLSAQFPKDLALGGLDRLAADRIFDLLQFNNLRKRVYEIDLLTAGANPTVDSPGGQVTVNNALAAETKLFECSARELAQWLAEQADQVKGVVVNGSWKQGVGQAWTVAIGRGDGQAVVVDLTDVDPSKQTVLAGWLADPAAPKAFEDCKAAWHYLQGLGIDLAWSSFDISLAAYLCFPDQRAYGVADLQGRLGLTSGQVEQPDLFSTLEEGQHLADLAVQTANLVAPLRSHLAENHLAQLLNDLEQPLTPLLAQMEASGIAVDQTALAALDEELARRVNLAQAQAFAAIGGREVNLASPKQLQTVLFEDLGMKPLRRTKTGHSTDAETLAELFASSQHPFLEHLLAHRDAIKLRQMVQGLAKAVGRDGRIHATFHQTVAATGRLSSAEPNLQNIPARTAEGRRIRQVFTPGEGFEYLMTADYSQIEMRIMAHLSGDSSLIRALHDGEDLHRAVAAQVFGVSADAVTAQQRSRTKAISYGLAYGLSTYGLARQLGLTSSEASALKDTYFNRFGAIRDYLNEVVSQARRTGFTQTIMGRRRYLHDLNSDNRQVREMAERMALNAPIQGSAADIMKKAMLAVDQALRADGLTSRILIQVHDELVLEVGAGERDQVEQLVRAAMVNACQLSMPLEVSVGVGTNWAAAAH